MNNQDFNYMFNRSAIAVVAVVAVAIFGLWMREDAYLDGLIAGRQQAEAAHTQARQDMAKLHLCDYAEQFIQHPTCRARKQLDRSVIKVPHGER